jgi:hypothetical protein
MQLYCKKCNYKLTPDGLELIPSNQANLKDGKDLIDPGLYINASEIDITFGQPIDFLINTASVNLNDHPDPSRLHGCCGPGNLTVLNQVCPQCSAEIGVIIEDCWLPHFIGISADAVSKEPLW